MPTVVKATRQAPLQRKDGRQVRKMTIYLPVDLAKRLAMHCTAVEVDMSETVAEALSRLLDARTP